MSDHQSEFSEFMGVDPWAVEEDSVEAPEEPMVAEEVLEVVERTPLRSRTP